jgi:CelD/BcsL family acetyltransferase involved in cellulose biosynthesis
MIEVVSDLAGLRELGEEWNELAARFASPFLRHEWNLACAEAFCESLRPAVHVLRSGSRIAAIAPLALVHGDANGRRRRGVLRLQMLGAFGSGSNGFLYRDEESLRELLERLFACRRPIFLSGLESDGAELRLLRELVPCSSVCVIRDAGAPYWVPLGPSWHEVEARIPAKRRSDLRRERKHAEKLGEVRFETITADEGNVDCHLEEFYRVEAAGWKTRASIAILSVPHARRHYTLYARAAARVGLLRLYFLRINGEAAAAQLVLDYGNRLWGLKSGYDEKFRRVSPGLLLFHEVLRHACGLGYETLEILGGAEMYKTIWTDRRRHYCSVRIYPLLSPLGGLALGQDFAALARRRSGNLVRAGYPWRTGSGSGRLPAPAAGSPHAGQHNVSTARHRPSLACRSLRLLALLWIELARVVGKGILPPGG